MTTQSARWKRVQLLQFKRIREEGQRIGIALGGSALLCLVLWLMRSRSLGRPLNIVAWTTTNDYNFPSAILRYRLEADAFPVLAILIYLVIATWGPLRMRGSLGEASATEDTLARTDPAGSRSTWEPSRSPAAVIARTVPAALFLGWSSRPGFDGLPLSRGLLWVLLSAGYVALVAGASRILHLRRRAARPEWELVDWVSLTNALACPAAAFAGLWWLSHTAAVRLANGSARPWSWIPIWIAALAVLSAWAWISRQLTHGSSPLRIESRIRVVVLGSVTMYVLTAALARPLGYLQGFDDSQGDAFARLVQAGYLPWRDLVMSHGPLADLLQPLLGFSVFQNSVWGANSGATAVAIPLCWVFVYLLGVWVARPGSAFVLVPLVWAASGLAPLDARFLFVPATLVLLGFAVARPSRKRTCALTIALFLNALATPESGFVVIGSAVALVAADLAMTPTSPRFPARLPRTMTFLATGALLTAAWAILLAATGALSGFVHYFQFFLGQHTAQSFILPDITSLESGMFIAMKLLAVVVILVLAWRLRHRLPFTPIAGVALASAIAAALYGEQAVGRMDVPHVRYSLQMGLPLFIICAWWTLTRLDTAVALSAARQIRSKLGRTVDVRSPVTIVAVAVFFLATSAVASSFESAPSRTLVQGDGETVVGPLGYMESGAIPAHELTDWAKIVRTYASAGAPFLDMTDAAGYFYYLLRLKPASVFTSLATALNPRADTILRNDVRASQPPLVAFSADLSGETAWDGVADNVRNYLTSQYVLSHWTPVVKSHGVVFLLRNDLLRKHIQSPHLSQPPVSADLYNTVPSCDWGDAPNFLQSTPVGPSVTVWGRQTPLRHLVATSGWAFDAAAGEPAREIVIMVGRHVESVAPVDISRPDVAAATGTPNATYTGFNVSYNTIKGGPVSAYALTSDGKLHLVPGATAGAPNLSSIKVSDGPVLRVGAPLAAEDGNLDAVSTIRVRVAAFRIPAGVSLAGYQLASFSADRPIGSAKFRLANGPVSVTDGTITMSSLPVSGANLPVRVGTCLQWHGYRGRTLYLSQFGGAPVTSLRLSDVRQEP